MTSQTTAICFNTLYVPSYSTEDANERVYFRKQHDLHCTKQYPSIPICQCGPRLHILKCLSNSKVYAADPLSSFSDHPNLYHYSNKFDNVPERIYPEKRKSSTFEAISEYSSVIPSKPESMFDLISYGLCSPAISSKPCVSI